MNNACEIWELLLGCCQQENQRLDEEAQRLELVQAGQAQRAAPQQQTLPAPHRTTPPVVRAAVRDEPFIPPVPWHDTPQRDGNSRAPQGIFGVDGGEDGGGYIPPVDQERTPLVRGLDIIREVVAIDHVAGTATLSAGAYTERETAPMPLLEPGALLLYPRGWRVSRALPEEVPASGIGWRVEEPVAAYLGGANQQILGLRSDVLHAPPDASTPPEYQLPIRLSPAPLVVPELAPGVPGPPFVRMETTYTEAGEVLSGDNLASYFDASFTPKGIERPAPRLRTDRVKAGEHTIRLDTGEETSQDDRVGPPQAVAPKPVPWAYFETGDLDVRHVGVVTTTGRLRLREIWTPEGDNRRPRLWHYRLALEAEYQKPNGAHTWAELARWQDSTTRAGDGAEAQAIWDALELAYQLYRANLTAAAGEVPSRLEHWLGGLRRTDSQSLRYAYQQLEAVNVSWWPLPLAGLNERIQALEQDETAPAEVFSRWINGQIVENPPANSGASYARLWRYERIFPVSRLAFRLAEEDPAQAPPLTPATYTPKFQAFTAPGVEVAVPVRLEGEGTPVVRVRPANLSDLGEGASWAGITGGTVGAAPVILRMGADGSLTRDGVGTISAEEFARDILRCPAGVTPLRFSAVGPGHVPWPQQTAWVWCSDGLCRGLIVHDAWRDCIRATPPEGTPPGQRHWYWPGKPARRPDPLPASAPQAPLGLTLADVQRGPDLEAGRYLRVERATYTSGAAVVDALPSIGHCCLYEPQEWPEEIGAARLLPPGVTVRVQFERVTTPGTPKAPETEG